jgi:hypothetical protein
MEHIASADVGFGVQVNTAPGLGFGLGVKNVYRFVCRDKDGNIKWIEEIQNRVTTQGLNDLLTKYLKGSAYTAAWYVGLIDNASFSALAATDVAAQIGGTNGWLEATYYSQATRVAHTLGTASAGSIDNSASAAVFTINGGGGTLYGGFIDSSSVISGTSGTLYGEGAFASTRAVLSGDTVTVTATCTAVTA